MKPGLWADVPKMLQTIKAAGYPPVPEDVRLTASGVVRKREADLVLELDGMKQPLVLALVPAKDDADTFMHLEERHLNQTVTLQGLWQPPGAKQSVAASLAVTAILASPPAADGK